MCWGSTMRRSKICGKEKQSIQENDKDTASLPRLYSLHNILSFLLLPRVGWHFHISLSLSRYFLFLFVFIHTCTHKIFFPSLPSLARSLSQQKIDILLSFLCQVHAYVCMQVYTIKKQQNRRCWCRPSRVLLSFLSSKKAQHKEAKISFSSFTYIHLSYLSLSLSLPFILPLLLLSHSFTANYFSDKGESIKCANWLKIHDYMLTSHHKASG